MIRFHLDEHFSPALANALRRHGVDVTTTAEAGLESAEDIEHVAFARVNDRVIVTFDRDYLVIAARGEPHSGIVYFKSRRQSIGVLLETLLLIHECMLPAEMHGRVEHC